MHLYLYFVTQSSKFYRHNLCVASQRVLIVVSVYLLRLGPETFGYILVQVTKLLMMQSSPASFQFFPLRSRYSPQHPVLKYPQSTRLRCYDKLSFTSIQSHG